MFYTACASHQHRLTSVSSLPAWWQQQAGLWFWGHFLKDSPVDCQGCRNLVPLWWESKASLSDNPGAGQKQLCLLCLLLLPVLLPASFSLVLVFLCCFIQPCFDWLMIAYIVPLSNRLTVLAFGSTWVTSFFIARIWISTKVVYLQHWHGWCHVKLLPSRCKFCVHHAPCHFMQSHIHKVYTCLAVSCHLHFWQNDRDLLRATEVTLGIKSKHRKLTWWRKFSCHSCRDSNPRIFNHESGISVGFLLP